LRLDVDTIYVQLLDEGIDVYRPVKAIKIAPLVYEISLDNVYDPEDENWEFLPGNRVVVKEKALSSGGVLVASELYT
jgi:hypothetical protein